MEDFFVFDPKNDFVAGDKPKVEKMAKVSTGCSGRKRLADISNVPQRASSLTQDNKSRPSSATIKEYIEQLQKENAALVKLLGDRNKIIELNGAELQKLRITLQKMQQQNLQFAQSNSQMLAELNSGKDRQKALQHELGCKNGLLIAKKLELEGQAKTITCQANDSKESVSEHDETTVCTVADKDDDKHCNTSSKQKPKSLGPSTKKVQDNDVRNKGRLQTRRQSARFKHDEPKPTGDIIVDIPPCPLPDDKMQGDDSNSVLLSVAKDDGNGDSLSDYKAKEHRKSSLSRPSRQAAKKVQSYKEINRKVKMRRPE